MNISRVFKRVYVPDARAHCGVAEFIISPPLHLPMKCGNDGLIANWPTTRIDYYVNGAFLTLKCIHDVKNSDENNVHRTCVMRVDDIGPCPITWETGERRLFVGQLSAYLSRHGATYGTYADAGEWPCQQRRRVPYVTVNGVRAYLDYDPHTGALNAIWANGVNIYRADFRELTLMNAEPGSRLLDSIVPVFKKLMQMHTDGECAIAFV